MTTSVPGISPENLAQLAGDGWANFSFGRDGLFYVAGWRRGFTPSEIVAQFMQVQSVRHLKNEAHLARKDLEAALLDAQEADRMSAWYRSQLVLESRMGLSLARIAG